jgi:hypothetical protein
MMGIVCGLGAIKGGSEYYYTDCCGNFISGVNTGGSDLTVTFDYDSPNAGVGLLNVTSSTSCATPTPTPTPTITPTNTVTPTVTPTTTQTPTPSITPSVTPSNSPVTRLKNNCDVVTLFDMGISCNVIQNPSSSTSLDGVISMNVTGGTAPYSYFWQGGQRTQTLFGVPQGNYEIVVVDYYGDYTASTICSLVGPSPTATPTMTPTPSNTPPIQCVDLCMIVTDLKGVTIFGPYQFTCGGTKNGKFIWEGSTQGLANDEQPLVMYWTGTRWEIWYSDYSNPFTINGSVIASQVGQSIPTSGWQFYGGLATGNITMTTGSCPEYPPLVVNLTSNNNTCQGMKICDGSITANVQGGLSPYYYSINGGVTTQTSPIFSNLCPANYTVNVYDSLGNEQSSSVVIGFNSTPVTYQLSVVDYGTPIVGGTPNVSNSLTKQYKIQSNPPIPVGTSITFNLTFSNTKTYQGPGNGTIDNTFILSKNGVQQTPTLVSNTPVVTNRLGCNNTQTGITQTNSIILTMGNGDDILINETSNLVLTSPQGSSQTNCTTTLLQSITSNITQVSVIGNECATSVGSSRNVLENSITYVPTTPPLLTNIIRAFGRLTNNSGGQLVFTNQPIEYVKCVWNNRLTLGYSNADGLAEYCDGEIQIDSQLYVNNTGTQLSTKNGNYVVDLSTLPTSLTNNYNLTPPGSKFVLIMNNGVVDSIINFNDIGDCPLPCTSC